MAIETADVVLMKNDLRDVVAALHLSKVRLSLVPNCAPSPHHCLWPNACLPSDSPATQATYRRILLNFFWAFLYNLVALPLAAGVFYPLMMGPVPPAAAGGAMALSSVSVVCSSLLLRLTYRRPRVGSIEEQSLAEEDDDNDDEEKTNDGVEEEETEDLELRAWEGK